MADLGLKPKNRKKFLKEEYPYNLITTIIDESVWELDLPTEMTEDHLAGLEFAISFSVSDSAGRQNQQSPNKKPTQSTSTGRINPNALAVSDTGRRGEEVF